MRLTTEETKRRTRFCVLAARGCPPGQAAKRAGYGDWETASTDLLGERGIRRRIAALQRELEFCAPVRLARAGLERLALEDPLPDGGEGLYHVAELRLPKGGGAEIKFCDRLRALELLAGLEDASSPGPAPLLEALALAAGRLDPGLEERDG